MTKKARARFKFEIFDGVLVITDQDTGQGPSVTNDIENVLDEIYQQRPDAPREAVYRDSTGIYDGLNIDEAGRFRGFFSLGETSAAGAVAAVAGGTDQ